MKRQRKMEMHPNGQYRVRIMKNGVMKNFFLGMNKKKARTQLNDIEREIASGRISFTHQDTTATQSDDGKMDMRIEELAHLHLKWVKANRSESTFGIRKRCVWRFIEFVGPCMVSDLSRIKMEEFYSRMQKMNSSPNSGNHDLREVKTMLLWGEEMELVELPFRKFPTMCHQPPPTKRVSEYDLAILLPQLPEDFQDMIYFGILTGLRPQELRGLVQHQIRHSSEGHTYLHIEGHKTAKTNGEPKPRTVSLCKQAEEIVERQIKKHPNSDIIFLNDSGTPYDKDAYRHRLVRGCRKVGGKDITPYALRHTFASMESDSGVETTSLSRLMGHAQTRTLERYITNSSESHLQAVQKVEARLKKIVGG